MSKLLKNPAALVVGGSGDLKKLLICSSKASKLEVVRSLANNYKQLSS